MIRASTVILVIVCVSTTLEQSIPNSPCPNVFQYEQTGFEPGQWYGVVNLSTDNTLHSLWLNIVLDGKANILGNWVGDVTTNDNIDFKIENTNMKIHPGPAVAVRFFVRYDKLNKPPRVQAIRLNGREICKANANPTIDRPDLVSRPDSRPMSESRPDVASRPVERPVSTRPNEARPETRPDTKPIIRAEDSPITRPVYGRPSGDGPVYTPTQNPPIDQSNVNPYSIGGSAPSQSVTEGRPYQLTTSTFRTTTRDDDDDSRPDPSEYFEGGQPTFIVSGSGSGNSGSGNAGSGNSGGGSNDNSNNRRTRDQCGKVVRNSPNPLVVNGKPTLEGQWPWQIALYQTQTVDNKYICGGTLVSHRHVITAAHCVTRKESARVVNKNTLTVYLGKHNLRTTVDGVQIRLVSDIIVNPRYNASSFSRDLGILRLRESVQYTDYVRPACLWPDDLVDLNNVIGKTGSVVGWGFDETGVATEELTLVEMPVVDHLTCIRSYSEFFSRFTSDDTYCAGFRDGTSVCNGDSGGGMVFRMQGLWYLRGLVSLSVAKHNEYRCDTSHYVIFTDLAKFLPWLKDNIRD